MELDVQHADSVKFGKFELVEQIGHGGMATVHRSILRGMGGFKREVVIKRILPELAKDEHFVKMFIEEAKLSALLDHPNIVQVYDFGVIDGHYYISMEFIQGVTLLKLRKHFRRRQPFPPEAAALIMHQVCLGLDYTHRLTRNNQPLGLVHRDVSPSNVMISAHGEVKLLDFGIAKAVEAIDDELTRTGTLKGKWSYMSPEQVVGAQVTYRSDIFAAGIVLWEILAGRRLFKDKTDFLTLSNVANARVPPISPMRPEVDPIFDAICARALAKNPEDRYISADEMADHLWSYLAQHPCTNSTLAGMIAPLLRDNTIELPPEALQEYSEEGGETIDTGSSSFSASIEAETSAPQSRESLTSLPAGEQEVVLLDLGDRRRRLITLATGGFVVATLLVVILLVLIRPGSHDDDGGPTIAASGGLDGVPISPPPPDSAPEPPAKTPAPKTEPPPPPKPEPPKNVLVKVSSEPPGALIRLVGEKKARGSAPLTLLLERSKQPVVLIASLAGHQPVRETVVPTADRELSLELNPLPPPPARVEPPAREPPKPPKPKQERRTPPAKAATPEKRRPQKTRKKGPELPDLKSGDLADPYGD